MKLKTTSLTLVIACAVLMQGCASFDKITGNMFAPTPGPTPIGPPIHQPPISADPVVVNAEKASHLAFDTIVACEKLEYENQAFVKSNMPQVHEGVEALRRNAKRYLQDTRVAIKAYKRSRTSDNKATIFTALAVLEAAAGRAKTYVTQLNSSTP